MLQYCIILSTRRQTGALDTDYKNTEAMHSALLLDRSPDRGWTVHRRYIQD
jgi:hypothetical protein